MKTVELVERQSSTGNSSGESSGSSSNSSSTDATTSGDSLELKQETSSRWSMGFLTKAMTSYLPSPVSDVLTQDRAFASVQLNQAGLHHQCVVTKLDDETKLIVACEDGFLYVYEFDDKGGECRLIRAHDLRGPLEGITGKVELFHMLFPVLYNVY